MNQERATQYAEELRQFSASHRVRFGHQHDLLTLHHSLTSSPGFQAEFGSMVRSILYREHEGVGHHEILALVEMTWSGSDRFERIPHLENRLGELSELIRELMSRPKGNPTPIVPQDAADDIGQLEVASVPTPEKVDDEPDAGTWTASRTLEAAWARQEPEGHAGFEEDMQPPEGKYPLPSRGLTVSADVEARAPVEASVVADDARLAAEPMPVEEPVFSPQHDLGDSPLGAEPVEPPLEELLVLPALAEVREDPWAEGSFLHREVMLFAEQRGRRL